MYFLVAIIVILILLLGFGAFYSVFSKKIEFFITGLDSKFTFSDLKLLWNVSQICELEQPTSLFWSMQSLTKCMAHITSDAAQHNKENDEKTQKLISKLFDYRTKLQNETDSKKGLDSTLYLDKGQKLRIILPGQGVFTSKILNNGKEIIISVPRKKEMIPISAENWMGKVISVYLWRANDARYVFDTSVINHGLFIGEPSISIKHSNNLVRTQNRKTVRAKCNIPANLYILTQQHTNTSSVETQTGYKCILEDISESGALIHIAGKGQQNVMLKLQFNIQSILIIMVGVVRTVEYNPQLNESLLHFECTSIEPSMKNEILSFVYNMLPEREKEVYEAISMTSQDEKEDSETNKNTENEVAAENASAASTSQDNQTTSEENIVNSNTSDNIDSSEGKAEADIFSLDDV